MGAFINSSVLRLLDANFNRAREALRVLEDYARFVCDDASLSEELKVLRHDLTAAVAGFVGEAVVHRDTPGDVGTTIGTAAEATRAGLSDVVIAAGKRLGEALRSIEEYLKTVDAPAAATVESIRYRFYATEQKVVLTLPVAAALRFADVRLYVLITESQCKIPWLEAAKQAIEGGADCLQLREPELPGGELLRRAKDFVALCKAHDVISIINDRPDIATLADADGVHVGQNDLPCSAVRQLLGRDKIVGVSAHNLEQAVQAERDGTTYIGVGPVFPSATKPRDFLPGLDFAKAAAAAVNIPTVAIAGITPANVDEVLATGVSAVAVTAAVVGANDVRAAARGFKERISSSTLAQPATAVCEGRSSGRSASPVGQTFLSATRRSRDPEGLTIWHRRLPHWELPGSTYFLTFRVARGILDMAERKCVLDHVKSGHGRYYTLLAATVMPDHAHAILTPNADVALDRITKGIKGVSARLVNQHRAQVGQVWQDETFDRIVRDQDELDEKLGYVVENALKADLVADPWEYEALYVNFEDR